MSSRLLVMLAIALSQTHLGFSEGALDGCNVGTADGRLLGASLGMLLGADE